MIGAGRLRHIGEDAAFPCHPFDDPMNKRSFLGTAGMTYRQWLIGQALAGYCAAGYGGTPKEHAEVAISAADHALSLLEKEP